MMLPICFMFSIVIFYNSLRIVMLFLNIRGAAYLDSKKQ